MIAKLIRRRQFWGAVLLLITSVSSTARATSAPGGALPAFVPINTTKASQTITLDGQHLSIDQIIDVARFGAKVDLSGEARQRQADNYGLLLEATAEGISVYWFNRATGDQRETVLFKGDATSPANRDYVARHALEAFQRGALAGFGPEVSEEEVTRAMMVVRANAMTFNAPSPPSPRCCSTC